MQLTLLSHLQLSSPPSLLLHSMMQLPLLSSAPLLSPISPLRDEASSPLSSAVLLRCSFLSSSLICSSTLLHLTPLLRSPLCDAASSPLQLSSSSISLLHLSSADLSSSALHSSSPALLSSAALHSSSSLLRFSSTRHHIGYPVSICHQNFIKDGLDIWHLSVGLTSDQHWSEFGDHCSCIWFGEETSYNMS